MKDYIEERAMEVASYIIGTNSTVRQAAKQFGISKSMVNVVVMKWNGLWGGWHREIDNLERGCLYMRRVMSS